MAKKDGSPKKDEVDLELLKALLKDLWRLPRIHPLGVYDTEDFCEIEKISRPTFYRWLTQKNLKTFSTHIGAKWRITGSQYARWVESREGIHDNDDPDADEQGEDAAA